MAGNVTSANAAAVLTVTGLFPAGVPLQKYSTDQAITQDEENYAETRMGIDGGMVAGYTPEIKSVTITIEPSSPSLPYFDALARKTKQLKTIFECTLILTLPALKKRYVYTGGVLKKGKPLPDVKKVLDPVSYTFHFENQDIQGI